MKTHHILLILALLAPAALSAKTAEQDYVDSYKGSLTKPAPVVVVSPEVKTRWAGKKFELLFVVDRNGKPRRIVTRSSVDSELVNKVIAAVSSWRFEPKLDAEGNPVPARVVLPIEIRRGSISSEPPVLYAGKKNARRDSWKRT